MSLPMSFFPVAPFSLSQIGRSLMPWLRRSLSIVLVIWSSLLLTGCVHYDVGIQFDHPNRGTVTQRIRLDERLQGFSGSSTEGWLDTLEQRTHELGGKIERLPQQEWLVTIPFSNQADLEQKFNQFFSPLDANTPMAAEIPAIDSHLALTRSNFLVAERNHLSYNLDLRSLGLRSANGDLLFSPGSLINLEFRLKTPWGARVLDSASSITAECKERDLLWQLIPGEQNHVEAIFWLPSPLGIGTLMIVGLVVLGQYLRYPPRSINTTLSAPPTSQPGSTR
jgi:hypothetical protein